MDERRTLVMPAKLAARHAASVNDARALHDQPLALRGLRGWREKLGLTQSELAMRTGLPMSLLGMLESSDHAPSPRTWALLARALEVDPACLLEPPGGTSITFLTSTRT